MAKLLNAVDSLNKSMKSLFLLLEASDKHARKCAEAEKPTNVEQAIAFYEQQAEERYALDEIDSCRQMSLLLQNIQANGISEVGFSPRTPSDCYKRSCSCLKKIVEFQSAAAKLLNKDSNSFGEGVDKEILSRVVRTLSPNDPGNAAASEIMNRIILKKHLENAKGDIDGRFLRLVMADFLHQNVNDAYKINGARQSLTEKESFSLAKLFFDRPERVPPYSGPNVAASREEAILMMAVQRSFRDMALYVFWVGTSGFFETDMVKTLAGEWGVLRETNNKIGPQAPLIKALAGKKPPLGLAK